MDIGMGRIKAIFIDRDGTINKEKNYVHKVEDFELIPGSIMALRLLTQHGVKIYIITNQSGIARGYYTEDQFQTLTRHMLSVFESEGIVIEQVLYCPHHPEGVIPEYAKPCSCRKPNTGLIEEIIGKNGFRPDEMALIGDRNSDIEAGRSLGILTYLVETGVGYMEKDKTKADYIKRDLQEAVVHLLNLQDKIKSVNPDK